MKKKNSNNITCRQLINFLLSAQIGVKLLQTPNVLAQKSGHDGWIPVIIVGILVAVSLIFIIMLLEKYKNSSIYDISNYLYGKYIGTLFNILILLYLWFAACLNLRLFAETLKINYLRFTPSIVLTFFIISPTFYLCMYGFKAIARFSFIIWFFLVITYTLLLFSINSCDIKILMPIGESGFSGILGGMGECYYIFLGFEIIVIIYPFITDKEKIIKYSLITQSIVITFFLSIVLICTTFFGENQLQKMAFPLIRLSRTYTVPIFERIDLLYISSWIPVMVMSVSSYFFPAYYSIQKLFKIKRKIPSLILFTVATVLISRIPKNHYEIYKYTHIIIIYGAIFLAFVILCYFFSSVKKEGVKTSE